VVLVDFNSWNVDRARFLT